MQISAEEFAAARSDPVAQFAAPIAGHMNADHADSTVAMLKHYVGIDVESASILSLDRSVQTSFSNLIHPRSDHSDAAQLIFIRDVARFAGWASA